MVTQFLKHVQTHPCNLGCRDDGSLLHAFCKHGNGPNGETGYGRFPKQGYLWGVPIIRTRVYWGLFWGPPF